jgi:RNA polymerase sigma-70 factor, ECF subfamily
MQKGSCRNFLRYLQSVGITPPQSVESAARAIAAPPPKRIDLILLEELWQICDASACGLTREEFHEILLDVGNAQNFGQAPEETASPQQQAAFFSSLRLADLVLAQACAKGHEQAWERFLAIYHQPLTRAAIAITGNDTAGRDLADALYAELYGLNTRDGERRCPLNSYKGRGSLIGWLRTTLAQRHVDHYRRSFRETPLDDPLNGFDPAAAEPEPEPVSGELAILVKAIEEALQQRPAEDRFLLAAYFLDERTLLQIAQVLHVHEATVSRKIRRISGDLRKQLLRNLQLAGFSKRAAQEALGTDPRDLDLNLKRLLQTSQSHTFQEKDGR